MINNKHMELTQAEEAIILKRRKDHRKHQLDTLQFDKAKVFDELKHIYESHSQTHKSVLDMIVSMKTKLEDEFNKFQML